MFSSPPILSCIKTNKNWHEVCFKGKVIQKGHNMKSFMSDVKSKDITCSVYIKRFEKS